ncbi:hypothetical protein CLV24_1205 [Pontibacter ummariensis]|uniref:Uncharacterized protein n=1 Tax=Pontibacter ummariensis TaxID=1610492 RepID=A0A239J1N4_9BACT|nr:hypothetical protein CLV24_1205 [Pontibacter ummariensis]SNS99831.1 hypothetical protein SAMN06296052_1204 [Pontibacter ummariensis]
MFFCPINLPTTANSAIFKAGAYEKKEYSKAET